eukprot:g5694.t1
MQYHVEPTDFQPNNNKESDGENSYNKEQTAVHPKVREERVALEDLPPVKITDFITSSFVATFLSWFLGTKCLGAKSQSLRRNYIIIINIVGIFQLLGFVPIIYSYGFNWTQTILFCILPIANYPITTQDECKVFESPLLITGLQKEENLKQFGHTVFNVMVSIMSAITMSGLPFFICVFPYIVGGAEVVTSDTDISTFLIMSYIGFTVSIINIPFNIIIGPLFVLNELHYTELKLRTTEYTKKVFSILIDEKCDSNETMEKLGKLHRGEKKFLDEEIKMRSRLVSTNFLFTVPLMLVGVGMFLLEPLDSERAKHLNLGGRIVKYLMGASHILMSVFVSKVMVGDASLIFKIYQNEIERHFNNPEILNVIVHKKFNGSYDTFNAWRQASRLSLKIYGHPVDETLASKIVAAFTSVMSIAALIVARRFGAY